MLIQVNTCSLEAWQATRKQLLLGAQEWQGTLKVPDLALMVAATRPIKASMASKAPLDRAEQDRAGVLVAMAGVGERVASVAAL